MIDLTGQRFERLLVLNRVGTKNKQSQWLCRCDCGTEKVVTGGHLRQSLTQSCVCLHRERSSVRTSALHAARTTHGQAGGGATAAYQAWESMKARCLNPNNPAWADYGGRGITIHESWLSFENFYADMRDRPADPPDWQGKRCYWTLDRIDPNGNYEPENCRWADPVTQATNRR